MNFNELLKRKAVIEYNKNTKIVCSTFGEFLEALKNENILDPIDQKDINYTKVQEICSSYKSNPEFFIAKSLFSIGYISSSSLFFLWTGIIEKKQLKIFV